MSINRNILECKAPIPRYFDPFFERINRNILECKVNLQFRKVTVCVVLIETYWNVKRFTVMPRFGAMRINRNILECKVVTVEEFSFDLLVLIETYWNVKFKNCCGCCVCCCVLIETYWNVKHDIPKKNWKKNEY